jgi:hypothetical protein
MLKFFSNRNIAAFYLILMCIQYIPIEGDAVSPVKVAAMCIAPLIIMIRKIPVISKATLFGGFYLLWVFFCVYIQFSNPRIETIGYLAMFVTMYIMFYNLVYSGAFTVDYFIGFLKFLISAYIVVLIIQQFFMLSGIGYSAIINHADYVYKQPGNPFKMNALSIEPSHSARILTAAFLTFLKTTEMKQRKALSLKNLFVGHKVFVCGFLYAMISMHSGTAMIGLGILLLYFMRKQYLKYIIPVILFLYFIIPVIDYEPLNRARVIIEAIASGKSENIKIVDSSAAARVLPMLNTRNNLDLTSGETWFGHGTDSLVKSEYLSSERMVGTINDYGLVAFILSLALVFICCIHRFLSVETLVFIGLMGMSVGNVYYGWGILMIFTVISYFDKNNCVE